MKNQKEINRRQRENRRKNKNKHTNKYEKTVKGFLMRKYRNMLSRVSGIQNKKAHLYNGKYILPREDFYEWAMKSRDFKILFQLWKASEYDRRLCPTVDRVDSLGGYTIPNIKLYHTHIQTSFYCADL